MDTDHPAPSLLPVSAKAHLSSSNLLPSSAQVDLLDNEKTGARLSAFAHKWTGAPPSTKRILTRGYHWTWSKSPPPLRVPFRRSNPSPELKNEVQKLVMKGAVYPVPWQRAYASPIFLVPKTTGGWRLTLDLSSLNQYIVTPKFRMTNHAQLAELMAPPAWMASLDLQDAYLHIPIRPSLHKYLAFVLEDQLFFFRALPFGLSPAPALFTRVLRWPLSVLRCQNVHLLAYLDDWVLWAPSKATLQKAVNLTCRTLKRLGWLLNQSKSHMTPSSDLTWLGVRWLPLEGRWGLPQEKINSIITQVSSLLRSGQASQRQWEQLVGKLNFVSQILRDMQPLLQPLFAPACFAHAKDRDEIVALPPQLLNHLHPWRDIDRLEATPLYHASGPVLDVWTDASTTGWGGHTHSLQVSGTWSPEERSLHINILEVRAVRYTITTFALRHATLHLYIDNQAAMFAINKMRCRSKALLAELRCLIATLQEFSLLVKAFRIASTLNSKADALSRQQASPAELTLPPVLFQALVRWRGHLQIDLMASSSNNKLPHFFSRHLDLRALGCDALTQDWSLWDQIYLFPPLWLIPKTMQKLRAYQGHGLLILPWTPAESWFQEVLDRSMKWKPLQSFGIPFTGFPSSVQWTAFDF